MNSDSRQQPRRSHPARGQPPSSPADGADAASAPPVPRQAPGGPHASAAPAVTCRRLDRLSDGELHALLRRIHALLLDRPAAGPELSVQILRADEARLLALYRALPPTARDEGRRHIERTLRSLAGGAVAAETTS